MKEGTVPVPPYRPCAYCDDDVVPVQGYRIWGGDEAAGVKPRERLDFDEHFSPTKKEKSVPASYITESRAIAPA